MKFFLASLSLALLAATVHCVPSPSILNTGSSAVTRSDDGLGNYAFGYNEDHATGGSFRKEKGGPGVQVGSYGLRDADGRMRVVSYVADAHGFRATISTNEPGVDPKQDPAAMDINGQAHAAAAAAAPAPITYAPAPIAHAPAPAYAAPVQTSSYQTSTTHIAPGPSAYAAPAMADSAAAPVAPVIQKSYAAPGPAAYSAPVAPVIQKSYAAPGPAAYSAPVAPVIQKSYAAPGPIAYAAESAYQANAQQISAISAAAPAYAQAAPSLISKAATYAEAAPVPAPAPIITKSYSIPSHALSAALAAPIKAYPAPGGLAGLPATYSIHTLG